MSVFDSVAKTITNLVGITSKGQATAANSLPVVLASDSDHIKAEDAAHSSGDKGVPALAVRKDSAAALAGSDADYTPLISDANGRVHANVGSLLTLTAAGQAAMAGSVPVVIASNQSSVDVDSAVADGADVALGATTDAAVSTDTTGTVSGKLRGLVKLMVDFLSRFPAALGQGTMAQSLPVTVASNQDFVHAEDAAHNSGDKGIPALAVRANSAASLSGSDGDYNPLITDSSGRLHVNVGSIVSVSAAGQASMASSVPVVIASDQTITSKAHWVAFRGSGAALGDAYDGDKGVGLGGTFNVQVSRNEGNSLITLDTLAEIDDYFTGADGTFDGSAMYFFIPLNVEKYTRFWINIKNELNISVDATLYGAMDTGLLFDGGSSPVQQVTNNFGSAQIATATVTDGSVQSFGSGGATATSASNWPYQYLILKVLPASDPSSGYWAMSICLAS